MPSRTSARRTSRAADRAPAQPLSLQLLERTLEAGAFMLRLTETLTPFAVVATPKGKPSLVSIDAQHADPDELEVQLVSALQADARSGLVTGAAWAYTIDVRTPDYEGPALKVYVDVDGETPFVAYTPYTFSMGEPAQLGDTHRLDAEASVLFGEPARPKPRAPRAKTKKVTRATKATRAARGKRSGRR